MISRRNLMIGATGAAVSLFATGASGQQVYKDATQLEPGEYVWDPQLSPAGPVAIIVSIPEQLVHVYRNGVRIGVSTCSTGKEGHETPTGVFTILEKDADHRSSTYNNAPMPTMHRLTCSGIALHAGNLPSYPASHGCIRLPLEFSAELFEVTHIGTPVIIAGSNTDPWELTHPGMILSGYAEDEFDDVVASLDGRSHPSDWDAVDAQPVTSIIVSSADLQAVLIENSEEIMRSPLTIEGPPILGEHVLILHGADAEGRGLAWQGITHHPDPGFPNQPEELIITRIATSGEFRQAAFGSLHPGAVMVVTDLPAHPDRRGGEDFVVMTTA